MKTKILFSHWYNELKEQIEVFSHYYKIIGIDYETVGIGQVIGYRAFISYKENM